MIGHFGSQAIEDAKAHAFREFPAESCGLIVGDVYRPCINRASDPWTDFAIDPHDYLAAGEHLRAVVHSHPNGNPMPSEHDIQGQITTDVPYVIIAIGKDHECNVIAWG